MNINKVSPAPDLKRAAMVEIITFLNQNANLPFFTDTNSNIPTFLGQLKEAAVLAKDKYKNQPTVQKSASALSVNNFLTSLYRDSKYALAGRKYLMGLGYHSALVNASQTACEYTRASKNAS